MNRLTDQTVFAELLAPVEQALTRVREAQDVGRVLSMSAFITLGVLRHLQGMSVLREQVQALPHLDPSDAAHVPLARSTWSDALAAPTRAAALTATLPVLVAAARARLPDRLRDIPGLGERPVRAIDGTYQKESAHFRRQTPNEGGEDNPKGHALLSFFDLRLGIAEDVYVETRSRHETTLLRDYDQGAHALTRERHTLWLLDRAFIDAAFWDNKKRTLGCTMITRMKSNLRIDSTEGLPVADEPVNAGVVHDLRITLRSSRQPWRLITFQSRRGHLVEFLTNDFTLEPGVVAFLYSRRWEEEKCFDTWKNDFTQAKAWGKRSVAIANQVRLAIITGILIAIMLHTTMGQHGIADDKALTKQDQRQAAQPDAPDGTDRPDWTVPLFRYTSKVSRQVLRFFKHCLLKPASPGLYHRELRPMLLVYL
ncbi:MAG TPA: transposase [Rubrivivax sp.]|nr:transposase [Rubrivivax sp.]